MFTKIILLLLSVALILQCSHANDDIIITNDTSSNTDDSFEELSALTTIPPELSPEQLVIDKLYYDRLKAVFRAIDEFYFLTYDVIRMGTKLFQDVLVDVRNSTTIEKLENFKAKISELTDYNESVDNFKPRQDYHVKTHIEALKLCFDQLEGHNATALENPSNVDLLLDASMRKNGLETVEQESILKLSKYLEKFSKLLNEFEESLEGREPGTHKIVKDWLMELHDLKTVLEKFCTGKQ